MKYRLTRWSVFLVCFLFARPICAGTFTNPFYRKSWAVMIAVENYKTSDWKKMITPIADAKGMGDFLKSRNFTVDTLLDKQVTKKSIQKYFEEVLPKKCGPRDRVVIFLSGHFFHRGRLGRKKTYFVPYEGRDRRVGSMIPLKLMQEWCNSLDALHVLLLVNGNWDNFTEERVEKRFWKPRSRGYYRSASRKKSRRTFSAGYTRESFFESGPSGTPYSLFAGNVITSLESGTADFDHDGIIGTNELAAFVRTEVFSDSQSMQEPVFGVLSGNKGGEMIFLSKKKQSQMAIAKTLAETHGTVDVIANVNGATVYIDKKPQKKKTRAGKPVSFKVHIGKHTVSLSKKKYLNTSTTKTTVYYGETHKIKFSIKKDPTLLIGYMVPIKGGEYKIGVRGMDGNNGPAHTVLVDDYYIGKYEVTNAEYMKFVKAAGYSKPPCVDDESFKGDDKPVVCVSWLDAVEYCKWKSKVTGSLYRLPTEAEWEIAARGNSNRKYPWGNQPPKEGNTFRANFEPKEDGYTCTAPVKSFKIGQTPNKIFHMGGNVYEWCSDWYDKSYYIVSSYQNPVGPEDNPDGLKVIRGGSWMFDEEGLYCTNRGQLSSEMILSDVGFRLVKAAKKR